MINASGTVTVVWSPALTFLPAKSYVALIRKVAHCSKSQFRLPPSLLVTFTTVIVSANLPVTETSGVSANVLFKLKTKIVVRTQIKNEKILNFFLLLIVLYLLIELFKNQNKRLNDIG